jgi:hypothetical protein
MIDAGVPGVQIDPTRGGTGHVLETLNIYGVRLSKRFATPYVVKNVIHKNYGANFPAVPTTDSQTCSRNSGNVE